MLVSSKSKLPNKNISGIVEFTSLVEAGAAGPALVAGIIAEIKSRCCADCWSQLTIGWGKIGVARLMIN